MSLLPFGDPRYDRSRTGPPAWAKSADTGPLNTYVPGPISDEPLENSHHTGVRLLVSGLIFVGVIVFVVMKAQADVTGTVLGLIGLWLLYAVPTWLRGRVGLRVDEERCEVRGWVRTARFTGGDVAKVLYVFAGRSPDVRLVLRDGRRVLVVASRLEKGHSTLFEWLRRYAPDAEYDEKSIDVRNMLVTRGLMGAPGDAWDLYGRGRATEVPDPISEEPVGEADANPILEEPVGEADATPFPEEHRDEGAVRPEGSPTDEDTLRIPEDQLREMRRNLHHRIPSEQPGEAPLHRVPEEHRDEVAERLEGPPADRVPPLAEPVPPTAGTDSADVPSDLEPPATTQARPESEDS